MLWLNFGFDLVDEFRFDLVLIICFVLDGLEREKEIKFIVDNLVKWKDSF